MNPYPHLTHDGGELLFSPTAIGHRLVISTMTTTKENSEIVFYHKFWDIKKKPSFTANFLNQRISILILS